MADAKKPAAALFIDGSNFYHSLKSMNLLPFGGEGFRRLFDKLSENYELKRIFFYDAIKNSRNDPAGYSAQQRFHERLKKASPALVLRTRKLRYTSNVTDAQVRDSASSSGIDASDVPKLWEFLRRLNLVRQTKEKGVDIMLVVDAVEEARSGAYSSILLLSGDADFVPAVNLIRSIGTRTINLHLYYGSSGELRNACDEHILLVPCPEGLTPRRQTQR